MGVAAVYLRHEGAVASVAFVHTTTQRTAVGAGAPAGKYGLVSRAEIPASAETGD
jgi:hypothetical protein